MGTFHHFSFKHLHRYVNEVIFRLNEGNVKVHMMGRIESLLQQAFHVHIDYRMLTKPNGLFTEAVPM